MALLQAQRIITALTCVCWSACNIGGRVCTGGQGRLTCKNQCMYLICKTVCSNSIAGHKYEVCKIRAGAEEEQEA